MLLAYCQLVVYPVGSYIHLVIQAHQYNALERPSARTAISGSVFVALQYSIHQICVRSKHFDKWHLASIRA